MTTGNAALIATFSRCALSEVKCHWLHGAAGLDELLTTWSIIFQPVSNSRAMQTVRCHQRSLHRARLVEIDDLSAASGAGQRLIASVRAGYIVARLATH